MIRREWTKEECIESAKLHAPETNWRRKATSIYNYAKACNFMQECLEAMEVKRRRNYYSFEIIHKEALKYTARSFWRLHDHSTYLYASRKEGWFDKMFSHMTATYDLRCEPRKYTKEKLILIASRFTSKKEWRRTVAYKVARTKGWNQDCESFIDEKIHMFSLVSCTKWMISRYVNEWKTRSPETLDYSIKNYSDKMFELGFAVPEKELFKICKKHSKMYEFEYEWKRINKNGSYKAAVQYGWIEELRRNFKPEIESVFEECKEFSRRFTSREYWEQIHPESYIKAKKHGLLKELCQHMPEPKILDPQPKPRASREDCMKEAKLYSRIQDWSKNSKLPEIAAQNLWLIECCSHMVGFDNLTGREDKCVKKLIELLKPISQDILEQDPLGNKWRSDITIGISGKKYILEVKHDETEWSSTEIRTQFNKYNTAGQRKYKDSFQKVIVCSPNGRYGISFKEVIAYLNSIK